MENSIGTIKLYHKSTENSHPYTVETAKYYSIKERKRIIDHWWRKYAGAMFNHFIQVAPGFLKK